MHKGLAGRELTVLHLLNTDSRSFKQLALKAKLAGVESSLVAGVGTLAR